ncbi:MAG: glycoside hydrolase family 31 protein [Bacteroidota bacterium]|nr:glycoside hydrolase family 31 protein [Bacteroidota bacterium]MDP4259895.1 glycoside hydrolase family 31 protein [Bacteroidota bacterium]
MKNNRSGSVVYSLAASLLCSLFFSVPSFARVVSYSRDGAGVKFKLDKGLMYLLVWRPDLVEVKYTIFDTWPGRKSLVVSAPMPGQSTFGLEDRGDSVLITTSRLKITVDKRTNAIRYADKMGTPITSESDRNKTMSAATIAGIDTWRCHTQFNSPADEALFGLGCHPEDSGSINYKGRDQTLEIKYMTGAIPVLLSTKGYGLLWDNYSASKFSGAQDNDSRFEYSSESGRMVDYYFFYGPDFDRIIDLYRLLTGKAPMFAKWTFGLFQSQDRYKTQEEILSVKDGYRNNHIPVDAIVQDWYWWSPLPIGSHVMNHERYPDPKAMIDELHRAHIHAMISIWPVFGSGTKDFDALKTKGFLTSITWDNFVTHTFDTYYDAHNPAARELYWDQARDSVVKRYGWDAWWVDQCEPDNGSLLDERRKAVFSVGKGIDYFNSYSLEHSKGIYKGWRRDIPGKRVFCLIRQSFAGEQRNAAVLWSSDISCTFSALRNQIPQGINACVSGIPYWTSDIGGYMSRVSPDGIPDWSQPQFRELFTRWFQFGTFSPIMRIHGKGERALFSRNWDDSTRAILLKYDKMRYRLLPYVYSLAGRTTLSNYTMMRGLAFDFRNDPGVVSIPDQYMFGPAFLVNPVTTQMYSGPHAMAGVGSRKVYLPKAVRWVDFWTGETLEGGQTVDADASIGTLPLYVRAGSIVPLGPDVEYATEPTAKATELRIYPGADGSFPVYEDQGDGYDYEHGAYATYTLSWNDRSHELTVSDRKGSFPGMRQSTLFHVVLVRPGHGSGPDICADADKRIEYRGQAVTVHL